MITLTAEIKLLDKTNGVLSGLSCNIPQASFSPSISSVLGEKKNVGVYEGIFILGKSLLGGSDKLSEEIDYYVGSECSNNIGVFTTAYTITVTGNNITSLTIAFDDKNNRHPTSIFTVNNLEKANTHTITITSWNTPNCPLVVSGIYVDITIEINSRNCISIDCPHQDRNDLSMPSWGVISSSGSVTFVDRNGEVSDYIEQGVYKKNAPLEIKLNNTVTRSSVRIGRFFTQTIKYDIYNRQTIIYYSDGLEAWQNTKVKAISYDFLSTEEKTCKDVYNILREYVPARDKMLSFEELDEETQNHISGISVPYLFWDISTLWGKWQEFCEVCQVHIYKNENAETICKYSGV